MQEPSVASLHDLMAGEAISKMGLSEQVYQSLLRKIVQRELPSGMRFTLRQTAQSLNVSMTPVRDAVLRLQIEGFVEVGPRGWVIPPLSLTDLREVFDARAMIELFAVGQAVERATDEEVALLIADTEDMESVFDGTACIDPVRYWELNAKFHQAIVAMSHNRRLVDLYSRLHVFALLRRLRALPAGGVNSVDCQEHRAIVAAFRARDPLLVTQILQAHLRDASAPLIRRIAENGVSHSLGVFDEQAVSGC